MKLYCPNCGYMVEIWDEDIYDTTGCPLCEHELVEMQEGVGYKQHPNCHVQRMRENIEHYGQSAMWHSIEKRPSAKHRAELRLYFFEALKFDNIKFIMED